MIIQHAPVTLGDSLPPAPPTSVTPPAPKSAIPHFIQKPPRFVTKFQFRKLFTTAERMAIDNAQYSSKFTPQIKAALFTMQKDLEVSGEVDLHLKDVWDGVYFLAQVGIITMARAARILNNLQPAI